MPPTTARTARLLREQLSLAHITVGWFALSLLIPVAFTVMPTRDQPDAIVMAWVLLSAVSAFAGPIQAASQLATDRNSGFIAFEQQRTKRSVPALLLEYAVNAQRFFVTAPLVTAPMMLWATRDHSNRFALFYPLIAIAAQVIGTVAALAVAASMDRRDAPGSTTGLSVLAVCGSLGTSSFALTTALRPTNPTLVYLALTAISTVALFVGTTRKLHDEEAPFFSVTNAIATQTAVVIAMLPLLVGSRVVEDGPLVLRGAFAFAWVIAALARNRASDGTQDLVRWSLDEHRRALDPRDPRRSLLLSAALSATCAIAVIFAPAIDQSTLGTFVIGAAIVVASSAHAVIRRTSSQAYVQLAMIGLGVVLVGWAIAASFAEESSALYLSCPSLLGNQTQVSSTAFATRASIVVALAVGAVLWAQRSFSRAVASIDAARE